MDVFHVFQRRVRVSSDRLKTEQTDAFRRRAAAELGLYIGEILTAHTTPRRSPAEETRVWGLRVGGEGYSSHLQAVYHFNEISIGQRKIAVGDGSHRER
jgi:hypothetical protein